MKKYLITMVTLITIAIWINPVKAYEVENIDIHGFISQGFLKSNEYNYITHNSKDGSFEYNEMGINFSKGLSEKLRIGVQLFARDIGDAANNKITLDWAYADYRWEDWFGLRIGKIKIPIGLHNETRDLDMLRTCIILPQGIYEDLTRDNLIASKGIGLYGNKEIGAAGNLSYQLLAGVLDSNIESGSGKLLYDGVAESGGNVNGENDYDTNYTGSFWWETPLEGLRAGYSFLHVQAKAPLIFGGVLETDLEYTVLYQILSAEYIWENLIVTTEYLERETKSTLLGNEANDNSQAYYVSTSYAFNDLFTLGIYYSVYYQNKDDKDGTALTINHMAWQKDLALTLRFDINEYWVFKVEGHRVDGTANVLGIDNPDNNYSKSDWNYFAAKASFSF